MIKIFPVIVCSLLVFSGSACKRTNTRHIQKLPGNYVYQKWEDESSAPRVISVDMGNKEEAIIIPGDVVWCRTKGVDIIYGEKKASKKPADWMSDKWGYEGYFIFDTSLVDRKNEVGDAAYSKAIKWVKSKTELEHQLKKIK